jgi:hypothetical protein
MENKASRWNRKKNPGPMVLQPRDQEIIKAVYEFRVISRQQLQQLFDMNGARRMNQRLRKLYDHKYLSRNFLHNNRGSAKAIYYLGPRGAILVADELGVDLNVIKRKQKATSRLHELFLDHALGLNDIRIAFNLGLANRPGMDLECWINDNDCQQQYHAVVHGRDVIKRFRPDGYFRIVCQGKLYSCFVEFDRSTMTIGRFAGKVHSYIDFGSMGYYQKRFGVRYFRVLVVTKTAERLNNLKKAVGSVTDKLFWFTTIDQITPNTVFGPIWQRVGKQELYPLIEL